MYMTKSVGPVGAMFYPDEVWGRCKPPVGSMAGVWWGKGTKSPESLKILHFALPKMVKNSKISDDGSELAIPRL